jgi:hypothetical protein
MNSLRRSFALLARLWHATMHPSFRLAPFALVALAACAVTPGDPAQGEKTAETASAIVGGTPVGTDTLGSVELLECLGPTSSCKFTYNVALWGCSGTQVAPGWILTAHHCVTVGGEKLTGGTAVVPSSIRVQSQSNNSWATGVQIFRHDTLDVALVKLDGDIYDDTGVVRTTPIFTGTGVSLIGQTVYCQGYGVNSETPAETGFGTLRSMTFTVLSEDDPGSMKFVPPASGGPYLARGDSGAGCFLHASGAGSPIVLVATHSYDVVPSSPFPGAPPSDEVQVGADGFETWASNTIGLDACTSMGASCGTTSDGMGNTVSCGTCDSGDVCNRYQECVCAPQTCEYPATWSYDDCDCEVPCRTPEQCCIQSGGTWGGKYCE